MKLEKKLHVGLGPLAREQKSSGPEKKCTEGDVIEDYRKIARILPYLKGHREHDNLPSLSRLWKNRRTPGWRPAAQCTWKSRLTLCPRPAKRSAGKRTHDIGVGTCLKSRRCRLQTSIPSLLSLNPNSRRSRSSWRQVLPAIFWATRLHRLMM